MCLNVSFGTNWIEDREDSEPLDLGPKIIK